MNDVLLPPESFDFFFLPRSFPTISASVASAVNSESSCGAGATGPLMPESPQPLCRAHDISLTLMLPVCCCLGLVVQASPSSPATQNIHNSPGWPEKSHKSTASSPP